MIMKKIPKWLYWTPRVVSILFIIFLSLFALDVFDENLDFLGTILALLMHLLPSIILTIIIIISWKYEIVGGIAFIAAGIFYIVSLFIKNFELYKIAWIFLIALPTFIIGILFLKNWKLKKQNP
jgi:hypothetical protein